MPEKKIHYRSNFPEYSLTVCTVTYGAPEDRIYRLTSDPSEVTCGWCEKYIKRNPPLPVVDLKATIPNF